MWTRILLHNFFLTWKKETPIKYGGYKKNVLAQRQKLPPQWLVFIVLEVAGQVAGRVSSLDLAFYRIKFSGKMVLPMQ